MLGLTLHRVLMLHAHPDDETLATGGLIAEFVQRGTAVSVLTATRGEQGEIVAGVLDPGADLVAARLAERTAALAALGVTGDYLLGQPPARAAGRPPRNYTDSGMQWGPSGLAVPADDVAADSLTSAGLDEVVADLVALLGHDRPDLVISYDEIGGYGHPDHVRMHRAGQAAAQAAGVPFAEAVPAAAVDSNDPGTTPIDTAVHRPRVLAALRAYRTQLREVGDSWVVHVGGQRQDLPDIEYLRLVDPAATPENSSWP